MDIDENAGLTLLVIDDEQQNLGLIESALSQPGLDILATTSPERGLALSGTSSRDCAAGLDDAGC